MISPRCGGGCSSLATGGSSPMPTNWALHVWYHCCGNLTEIAEDFHEIGVDVLNISQPNVVDLDAVSQQLRGRQCFMMPISYQTVSIQGTPDEILAEAERMYRLLGTPHRRVHRLRRRVRLHGHVGGKLPRLRRGLSATDPDDAATAGKGRGMKGKGIEARE